MAAPVRKMTSRIIRLEMANNAASSAKHAFTLIELILVMALLVITIALVTPSVGKFFGGRTVESEVNRFVALTHYGQSRAVSEGTTTMLWIDTRTQHYGLKLASTLGDTDTNAIDYKLADGLKIDVTKTTPVAPLANSQTGRILNNQAGQNAAKFPAIYFSPDGTFVRVTSVSGVSIAETNHPPVWIGPTANRLAYEIQDQNTILANAAAH
jgi:prepilin-type N-terminal cleavage/methylation domain-containing protein